MKFKHTFIALLGLSIALTSCENNGNCVGGSGNFKEETRTTSTFDGVDVQVPATVYLEYGTAPSVTVKASDNIMYLIETVVESGTLHVRLKNGECIKGNTQIEVHATLAMLNNVILEGTGTISNLNAIPSADLHVNIQGSGTIQLTDINPDNYSIYIQGTGDISIAGTDTVTNGNIDISGSGDIITETLPTKHVSVDISGTGNVDLYALETLNVKIEGSGDVRYFGSPSVTSNISGSGNIIKK